MEKPPIPRIYLIGKKSVGKKFRRQKFSLVKNIRHQGKNSSLFIDGFFTDKVLLNFLDHTVVKLVRVCFSIPE